MILFIWSLICDTNFILFFVIKLFRVVWTLEIMCKTGLYFIDSVGK